MESKSRDQHEHEARPENSGEETPDDMALFGAQSESTVASIGYTGVYAFANVLLTIAGALIVLL